LKHFHNSGARASRCPKKAAASRSPAVSQPVVPSLHPCSCQLGIGASKKKIASQVRQLPVHWTLQLPTFATSTLPPTLGQFAPGHRPSTPPAFYVLPASLDFFTKDLGPVVSPLVATEFKMGYLDDEVKRLQGIIDSIEGRVKALETRQGGSPPAKTTEEIRMLLIGPPGAGTAPPLRFALGTHE
jgi:hypothetical protein